MVLEYWWMLLIWVAILAVIVAVVFLAKSSNASRGNRMLFANTKRLTENPEYRKASKRYKKGLMALVVLTIVAGLSASVTASKPVTVTAEDPVKYNRDVVLCLDVSGSMIEVDLLVLSKFDELVDGFKGERIALVVFNSVANQVFPLTDDYGYIKEQMNLVRIGLNGDYVNGYDLTTFTVGAQGSSLIGDGLAACALSFDNVDDEERSRSIIFATDNVTAGEELINLNDAAALANDRNINVYGINPEFNIAPREALDMETALESNGGSYYSLDDVTAVPAIIDQIQAEQTSAVVGDRVVTRTDTPQIWILITTIIFGLICFIGWRFKV